MTGEKESFRRGTKKAMSLVSQHFGIRNGTHNVLVQILRIIPCTVLFDLRLVSVRVMANVPETECHKC